jgi:ferredoxin-NADP reductase
MLRWQTGTVVSVWSETPRTKSFRLSVPGFGSFRPGQRVDIRLTAPDGYQAHRSYSIASAPAKNDLPETIDLTVELIENGEVSPYFHEVVQPGDKVVLRGPIGGPFTWAAALGGPLLLVAGGSGIVPLMSMLRYRASYNSGDRPRAALLYSSRYITDVIYLDELSQMAERDEGFDFALTLTRDRPTGWSGYGRRVDGPMLSEVITGLSTPAHSYVCGPTEFVESVSTRLLELGLPMESIHTERFGPSGT